MKFQSLGFRKGAWSADEDLLLTRYVSDHGEGNWHIIPQMTGLNRCRKSCRLRWLNYLSPNIKRGTFEDDEIDLIVRLHKLLGNRWSLIAGRIPGRTANDVKNFWNTNLKKIQQSTCSNEKVVISPKFDIPCKVKAIKPQPRTFSKSLPTMIETQTTLIDDILDKTKRTPSQNVSTETLLQHEQDKESSIRSLKSPHNGVCANNILNEDIHPQQRDEYWRQYLTNSTSFNNWETGLETNNIVVEQETLPDQNNINWADMLENLDIWSLLHDEQITR